MNATPTTNDNFVERLVAAVPEMQDVVSEHLSDNYEELLLHLLVADLRRAATSAWGADDFELCARLLEFMSSAFETADDDVDNAIAVSFVEHIGAWPEETPDFIASWPEPLLVELDRQRQWRPPGS